MSITDPTGHHPADNHGHPYDHDHDGDAHQHHSGFKDWLFELFVPHTHDSSDSIDNALEASKEGVRALKISMVTLLATTVLQVIVVAISGSVALLADTIHNFSDALTAVPLWIAFILGRRVATKRYTYGYGRAEDLAGLFIVAVIALSAILAAWQSIDRLFNPQPLENLWWVLAAGVIGFAGNEIVAVYRIRVGQKIGSAALVADGVHARTDGFTSLAVVLGAGGVMLGFPLADPIVGLLISVAIIVLLWGTVRSIGRRLMDGIEPELVARAQTAIEGTPGILAVPRLQLRWVGHRLQGAATVVVADGALSTVEGIVREAEHRLGHALPKLDDMVIKALTASAREKEADLEPSTHNHH
ncbi:cation transporter [Arthrobacter sp. AQ5-05]|uniref:cation diffusion facilitator family transporter n=1 Tax=Arthrobacter sp. AQ5-05 TaxID=2184581 RepID=UPI000DCB2877|nr:cation diffusion facilitator family transporter [Arthrobacter sp. AQ5-05]RAX45948.1 cation transporter [Arthrobacter sp. AQ5-05]